MMTKEQWRDNWKNMTTLEFIEKVQRDAWEQGVEDGYHRNPGEPFPVFPGDRK